MKGLVIVAAALFLAACSDSGVSDEAIWFEDGYNQGQYDVCRELASISRPMMLNLSNCNGLAL